MHYKNKTFQKAEGIYINKIHIPVIKPSILYENEAAFLVLYVLYAVITKKMRTKSPKKPEQSKSKRT